MGSKSFFCVITAFPGPQVRLEGGRRGEWKQSVFRQFLGDRVLLHFLLPLNDVWYNRNGIFSPRSRTLTAGRENGGLMNWIIIKKLIRKSYFFLSIRNHFEDSKPKTKSRSSILIFLRNETSEGASTTSSYTLITSKEGTRNSFSPRYDENSSSWVQVKEKLMGTKSFFCVITAFPGPRVRHKGSRGGGVETKWKQSVFRHTSVIGCSLAFYFLLTMFGTIEMEYFSPPSYADRRSNSKPKTKSRSFFLIFLHNETSEQASTTSSSTLIPSTEGTRNSFSPRYDENSSSSEVKEKLMGSTKIFFCVITTVPGPQVRLKGGRGGETKWKQSVFRHSSVIGCFVAFYFLLTMFGTIEMEYFSPPLYADRWPKGMRVS
ncbi:hypothetical protein CDAR_486731 [Caerostris darwini]|uniref:Uncharacterized protein n=1 Tax=Caerostris darwini TaxID=1538125 RepID=A0AAV4P3B6_9ARAC|nr:hypothetical protein CDAR_486731 [Caerostris darwini]